jgi:ubiquinone/menaquinone biosynthesis C-methylase UbiE
MGLTNITSIDFESAIIKKMNARESPVEYKVMDMLNMDGIADNSIDYIIDKGSLDALCADQTPETQAKVIQYFNEVQRVLAEDGTYMGVSLL